MYCPFKKCRADLLPGIEGLIQYIYRLPMLIADCCLPISPVSDNRADRRI
jgi:hypothetical protein